MRAHRGLFIFAIVILGLVFSSCKTRNSVCPPNTEFKSQELTLLDLVKMKPEPDYQSGPVAVEIAGKMVQVDKLVNYPICNDTWTGVVYVDCDAEVAQSSMFNGKNPLFFKGCDLKIKPNTIVYVAAHNDAPYYKGCSCHTGDEP